MSTVCDRNIQKKKNCSKFSRRNSRLASKKKRENTWKCTKFTEHVCFPEIVLVIFSLYFGFVMNQKWVFICWIFRLIWTISESEIGSIFVFIHSQRHRHEQINAHHFITSYRHFFFNQKYGVCFFSFFP